MRCQWISAKPPDAVAWAIHSFVQCMGVLPNRSANRALSVRVINK